MVVPATNARDDEKCHAEANMPALHGKTTAVDMAAVAFATVAADSALSATWTLTNVMDIIGGTGNGYSMGSESR